MNEHEILATVAIDSCVVDVAAQKMLVHLKSGFKKSYVISTAVNGIGNESGSYKTPLGKHQLSEKIGAFAPMFAVFKAGEHNGDICEQMNTPIKEDLLLTRILRLRGLEPGVNSGNSQEGICVDSWQRGIYIHGTNREDLLGTTASHGCIRMANADIVELFMKIQQDQVIEIKPKLGM